MHRLDATQHHQGRGSFAHHFVGHARPAQESRFVAQQTEQIENATLGKRPHFGLVTDDARITPLMQQRNQFIHEDIFHSRCKVSAKLGRERTHITVNVTFFTESGG